MVGRAHCGVDASDLCWITDCLQHDFAHGGQLEQWVWWLWLGALDSIGGSQDPRFGAGLLADS